MDYLKEISLNRDFYKEKQKSLSKEEIAFISSRDTLRGKLLGFLTKDYWKKKELILKGDLLYGYAFKSFEPEPNSSERRFPVWVLFSPSREFNEQPLLLKEVAETIINTLEKDVKSKEEKRFLHLVHEPYGDASYLGVPSIFTNGKLIYMSIVYFHQNTLSDFHLGLNFLIAEASISKEVILLPGRYFDLSVYKDYIERKL